MIKLLQGNCSYSVHKMYFLRGERMGNEVRYMGKVNRLSPFQSVNIKVMGIVHLLDGKNSHFFKLRQ